MNALCLHLALENGTVGTRTQLSTLTPIQRGIAQILEQLHHDIFRNRISKAVKSDTSFYCFENVQLVVNWWFGILRVHLSNNLCHNEIAGIQTTNPNHQFTISWIVLYIKYWLRLYLNISEILYSQSPVSHHIVQHPNSMWHVDGWHQSEGLVIILKSNAPQSICGPLCSHWHDHPWGHRLSWDTQRHDGHRNQQSWRSTGPKGLDTLLVSCTSTVSWFFSAGHCFAKES